MPVGPPYAPSANALSRSEMIESIRKGSPKKLELAVGQEGARPPRPQALRTATTEREILRQLARFIELFNTGRIDFDAPRGSYINIVV